MHRMFVCFVLSFSMCQCLTLSLSIQLSISVRTLLLLRLRHIPYTSDNAGKIDQLKWFHEKNVFFELNFFETFPKQRFYIKTKMHPFQYALKKVWKEEEKHELCLICTSQQLFNWNSMLNRQVKVSNVNGCALFATHTYCVCMACCVSSTYWISFLIIIDFIHSHHIMTYISSRLRSTTKNPLQTV